MPGAQVALRQLPEEGSLSDNTANKQPAVAGPSTIAEVLEDLEPMGDLTRFAIDDLTPDEEDEFFEILEDA